jgi:cyclic pyranopterin phosphate synthase
MDKTIKKAATSDTICYEAHGNLYLNITNRCTARCVFCIREFSDGVYGYNLRLSHEPSVDEIIDRLKSLDLSKYREVVFTGFGEPTVRLDSVLEITRWLSERGISVRLDTNGHGSLLYPDRDVVSELKEAGLSAMSVSLNAESEELYEKLCLPAHDNAYQALLEFTRSAVAAGLRTRITVVDLPEIDVLKCKRIAHELGADFYVR